MADPFSQGSTYSSNYPNKWQAYKLYNMGEQVVSPTDFNLYTRKVTGIGNIDPTTDTNNWHPTVDRSIKSIQRGVAAATPITISAVNMAKTELRWLGGVTSSAGVIDGVPTLQLTSSTQISAAFNGTSKTVGWELTERY